MKYIGIFGIALSLIIASFGTAGAQSNTTNLSFNSNILYGLDVEKPGIQLGLTYDVTKQIRGGLDFTKWYIDSPETTEFTHYEYNFNGHYIFKQEEKYGLYGIGTLGLHVASYDCGSFYRCATDGYSKLAVGIGAGAEYGVGPFKIYFKPRYFLRGFEQLNLGLGLRNRL